MTKYKLPVLLPPGAVATISQPFGKTANTIEPVGPHGEQHFHYGVDLVFGNDLQTFGTPFVSPFPIATMIAYTKPTNDGSITPYIELEGRGASGNDYKLVLAHVSTILIQNAMSEGTIVGTCGNYGMVAPKPDIAHPFAGSHLHLGLIVNGDWHDPLDYFDIHNPYIGPPHDPLSGVPRIIWAIDAIRAQLGNL